MTTIKNSFFLNQASTLYAYQENVPKLLPWVKDGVKSLEIDELITYITRGVIGRQALLGSDIVAP